MAGVLNRLYTGTGAFDIIGRKRLWYTAFSVLVLICIGSIVFRGFNLGIDFTGGTQIQFPATTAAAPADVEAVRGVYERVIGHEPEAVQSAGTGASASILIRSQTLDAGQLVPLKQALFDTFKPIGGSGAPELAVISDSAVSGSWGGQITRPGSKACPRTPGNHKGSLRSALRADPCGPRRTHGSPQGDARPRR